MPDADFCTSTTPTFRMRRRQWPAKHRGERYRSRGVKAPSRCMARIVARMAKALEPGISSPPQPWFQLSVPGVESPEVERWLRQCERLLATLIPTPRFLLDPAIP